MPRNRNRDPAAYAFDEATEHRVDDQSATERDQACYSPRRDINQYLERYIPDYNEMQQLDYDGVSQTIATLRDKAAQFTDPAEKREFCEAAANHIIREGNEHESNDRSAGAFAIALEHGSDAKTLAFHYDIAANYPTQFGVYPDRVLEQQAAAYSGSANTMYPGQYPNREIIDEIHQISERIREQLGLNHMGVRTTGHTATRAMPDGTTKVLDYSQTRAVQEEERARRDRELRRQEAAADQIVAKVLARRTEDKVNAINVSEAAKAEFEQRLQADIAARNDRRAARAANETPLDQLPTEPSEFIIDAPQSVVDALMGRTEPREKLSWECEPQELTGQEILTDGGAELCDFPPGNAELEDQAVTDYAAQAVADGATMFMVRIESTRYDLNSASVVIYDDRPNLATGRDYHAVHFQAADRGAAAIAAALPGLFDGDAPLIIDREDRLTVHTRAGVAEQSVHALSPVYDLVTEAIDPARPAAAEHYERRRAFLDHWVVRDDRSDGHDADFLYESRDRRVNAIPAPA